MGDVLEKLLDDIIGDKQAVTRKPKVASKNLRGSSNADKLKRRGQASQRRPPHRLLLPREIEELAHGRSVLRVKNIHPDLNGQDLSDLFGAILSVDFVKFDTRNDTIAYVCFQRDDQRSYTDSVQKYDGRKAMGQVLGVEIANGPQAVSLADRVGRPQKKVTKLDKAKEQNSRRRGGKKEAKPREEKHKRGPVLADDLDKELNAYMAEREQMQVD